ncbi:MAG: hypothetical protein ACQESK_06045 [Bacteroidota bacterium]
MKKKILGLLPLMVLMFLMSCSDDDFKEENLSYSLKNNNRLNFVNTIGESDLQRENPTLYQSLESINTRSADSGNDMLEIDLKKINKIELDSATSYVFRIKFLDQPENKFVDNMVYTRYYDRKEYVSWLRYDFDENDKSSIIERNLIRNFSDKLGLIGVGTTLNEDVHLYESFSFLSTENEDDCLITIPDAGSTLHTCYPYDGSDPYSWTGSESHGCNGDLEHTVQDLVLVDYFCHLSGGGAGDNPGDGYGGSPGPSFPGVPPSGGGSSGGGSGGDPTAPGQGYPDPEDPSQEFPILTDGNGTIISFPNIELPEPPEDDEDDCEKIKNHLEDEDEEDSEFKEKLLDLTSNENLTADYEKAVLLNSSENVSEQSGNSGEPEVMIEANGLLTALAHTHPSGIEGGTYSVFSPSDFEAIVSLMKDGVVNSNNFVSFLATGDDTYYALTIEDADKLYDFFYPAILTDSELLDLAGENFVEYQEITQMQQGLHKDINEKYFEYSGSEYHISENEPDNEKTLENFLNFLKDIDAGVNLYETDEDFEEFTKLELDNNDEVSRENNCN